MPTFDGKYEHWLSFKHTFTSIIDSQSDLNEQDKLHYLQTALTDEAANKINVLLLDNPDYTQAWDLLKRSYEVKRILISRHLHFLMHLPIQGKETSEGLMKLADDAQQHVLALKSLGVTISSEILVHILEEKLHKNTLEKWEETLDRDRFPTIDEMYEFLYKSAVRVSKRKKPELSEQKSEQYNPPSKKKRPNESTQAFIVNSSNNNCVVCKDAQHPLFKCKKFAEMSVANRINIVKSAHLCFNCMRDHRGSKCKFGACKHCQKNHNSMLHYDKTPKTSNQTKSQDDHSKTAITQPDSGNQKK